ncbi:MAG: DUF945 family protein [Woeseiaceae bacterium]
MKKGIVAVLVILAIVVIVSPGILGRLAEKSVDENLNWAASEQGDVVVSSDNFDRGWFSSEGQHRIEIKGGNLGAMLVELSGPGEPLPVLVINTHLDHGLIPFSSLSRENGSLAPGLGSAVSTLSVELGDGATVELPGKIFSSVALGGALQSSYQIEPGSRSDGHKKAAWGTSKIDVTADVISGNVDFAGDIQGVTFSERSESLVIDSLTFSGKQAPTKYGFSVGDMTMQLNGMSVSANGVEAGGIKSMSVDGHTKLDGDRVGGRTTFKVASQTLPMFGDVTVSGDVVLDGANARAIGDLSAKMRAMGPGADETQTFAVIENDLKHLLASGLEMRFDQLDVASPMGAVEMDLRLKVSERDTDAFEWSSLLLATEGSANLSVPEALVEMALAMNPQAGAVVAILLQKNGNVYEMAAKLEKGLMTINGAPIPIPLGAF